jgi:predicted nucleic acid-binding protein
VILIDTGAFYALVDKNDINHADAKRFYKKIAGKETLCTSLPILTETWLLIEARLGSYFANKLWISASKGVFEILELERDDLENALEIENKYHEAGFGFVDSTCFALCEKYKIQKVFTYDRKHFRLYKPSFSDFLDLLPPK